VKRRQLWAYTISGDGQASLVVGFKNDPGSPPTEEVTSHPLGWKKSLGSGNIGERETKPITVVTAAVQSGEKPGVLGGNYWQLFLYLGWNTPECGLYGFSDVSL
jgi:hypothetical protein